MKHNNFVRNSAKKKIFSDFMLILAARLKNKSGIIMRKIVLKAVAIGAVTDIVCSNIAAMPLILYVSYGLARAGVPKEKALVTVVETIHSNPLYFFISILLGGLCSMLGGYVSARIAKHHEILNGALASFLCVASGVYALLSPDKSTSILEHLSFLPLGPLLSTAGGYLRARQKLD